MPYGELHSDGRAQRQTEDLRLFNSDRLHQSRDVVCQYGGRIFARRLVALAGVPQVDRDACELLTVLGNLKGITRVVRGQERNKDYRLARTLLLVVHG